MRRNLALSYLLPLLLASSAFAQATPPIELNLAGTWRFAMDRTDNGLTQQWFAKNLAGADTIKLPGILQAQGFGDDISVDTPWVAALPRDMKWFALPQYAPYTKPGKVKMPYLSQPPKHYLGVAWYQRDVTIPAASVGKREHLLLERPRWGSIVWLDDKQVGTGNSLVAPHEFDLGIVAPGPHRLTVRLDNRMNVVPGYRPDGHGVSDALGAAWNGMAGKVELQATSPVFIDDAQAFPNLKDKSVTLKVHIGNITGKAGTGTVQANGASTTVSWTESGVDLQLDVPLSPTVQTWDEFHPVLQHLTVTLQAAGISDSRDVSFGFREISHIGKQLLLNGKEINLRFTHSGGDFPLTGYPATDVPSWKKSSRPARTTASTASASTPGARPKPPSRPPMNSASTYSPRPACGTPSTPP